ncbi:MAG: tRNA (adenosine(37)-N6)-dimethylallyltransferase MiaA [Bacteroidia bacterium]
MSRKSIMEHLTNPRLIVLAGPTAVGKTSLAIKLALHLDTEIVSCDSRQLYKELDIGVARPTQDELSQVKHHFIASHSIHDEYNAGRYAVEVNELLTVLFKTKNTVIMTGGTGLYIQAATLGLDILPQANQELRRELKEILNTKGISELQSRADNLKLSRDNVEYENPQRLMRAIEIAEVEPQETVKKQITRAYDTTYLYVNRERNELYDRINQRVDIMLEDGFEDEARSVYPFKEINALQTVGYREFFKYFDGDWTREEAIEKMKQKTRNYAKRQLTWFRNQGDYIEVKPSLDSALEAIRKL